MSKRIFTVNVGVNASHASRGLKSPIFLDGTFEFIPIPWEGYNLTYAQLRSFYNPKKSLSEYIPQKYHQEKVHNDPDLVNMTYGDFPDSKTKPRAAALRNMKKGDFLLFWARLYKWKEGKGFIDKGSLYFVSLFEIEKVFRMMDKESLVKMPNRVRKNAHIQMMMAGKAPDFWKDAWVFMGSKNYVRFRRAVPLRWDWASKVFLDKDNRPWKRKNSSEQRRIGSYLRTCRCQIDLNAPEGKQRAERLFEEILKFNPRYL